MSRPSNTNLFDLFEEMSNESRDRDDILVSPFGYPGGKSRSVKNILPHLPNTSTYVEAFGGGGTVLLSRPPSKLEVFNDRFGGVVEFYRCIRTEQGLNALCDRLDLTIHSREEFEYCRDTWEDCENPVERAARWYYMVQTSFTSQGRHFGRATKPTGRIAGKVRDKLPGFAEIHRRMREVQIENLDWRACLRDYDSYETVFYLDPPYIDSYGGMYKHDLLKADHRELIDMIFSLDGFVAVSGYSNPLYDNQPWDDRQEWQVLATAQGHINNKANRKANLEGIAKGNTMNTEVLWIKEAG